MHERIVSLALALGIAFPATAAELIAGPVVVQPNAELTCTALNQGKKEIQVEYEAFIQLNPIQVTDLGTIQPDGIQRILNTNFTGSDRGAYCRFTFKGGKKNLRATASVKADGSFEQVSEAR